MNHLTAMSLLGACLAGASLATPVAVAAQQAGSAGGMVRGKDRARRSNYLTPGVCPGTAMPGVLP